jgi:signal peptidase I
MKKIFYFLFLFPVLVFSQVKQDKYDYFVQFNTTQFAKKVNMDSLFNHKVFKSVNEANSDFKLNDFISFIDKTKSVTIHGNFTDSIAYYQMTFPLKDTKGWNTFIQNKVNKNNLSTTDSIQEVIKVHSKHSVYSPKKDDFSVAWNENNFIIYGLVENNFKPNNSFYTVVDTSAVSFDEDYYEEEEEYEVEDVVLPPPPPPVKGNAKTIEVVEVPTKELVIEEVVEEAFDDEEYKKWLTSFEQEQAQERIQKHVKQEEQIALLFENGFVTPTSSKINTSADISCWMNYEAVYGRMSSIYYLMGTFNPNRGINNSNNSIKGMNMDFYFENNKARMEQKVEYSESLANVMQKVVARKPNKNIYNYFPKQDPLAFFSYHSSTEELLKNYPEIMEQFLGNMLIDKQDTEIITDLISTIVDEEATATLFDGDISMFLHAMETYESTFMSRTYDEDYEEIEEEKTITKTRPIFTMIMTSTHPTMGDKLLNLGVRKNLLQKQDGYYLVNQSEDLGDFVILKRGDVMVFTNGLNYLNDGSKSDFTKKVKKDLTKNYFYGNFEMQRFFKAYVLNLDLGSDTAKMIRLGNQFKNMEFKASNKLNNRIMKLEMEINSNFSNENIVLQTLDLIDFFD